MTFFPNPVLNYGTLEAILHEEEEVNIIIINDQGIIVRQLFKQTDSEDKFELEINFDTMQDGLYMIILKTKNVIHTTTVIHK